MRRSDADAAEETGADVLVVDFTCLVTRFDFSDFCLEDVAGMLLRGFLSIVSMSFEACLASVTDAVLSVDGFPSGFSDARHVATRERTITSLVLLRTILDIPEKVLNTWDGQED